MLMALVSRPFRMDCFAFISKTKVSSRRNGGPPNRDRKAADPDEPNNEVFFLGSDQKSHRTSSVTISFGACKWILYSQGTGFVSSNLPFYHLGSLISFH